MVNWETEVDVVARRILGEPSGQDFYDGFLDYVKIIIQTRRELMEIRQEITQIPLSRTGYRTQAKLGEKERRFQELSQTVEQIHEGMVTGSVWAVDGVEGGNPAMNNQLLEYVEDGTIPSLVDGLEHTMAQVGQQLESKKNTANSRMVLVASSLAAFAASGSLVVAAITLIATLI